MLLSLSTKPLAKQFMKKYIDEIMPQITNTGKYISSVNDQKKIDELNKVIDKLRNKNLIDENIFLDNKYRFKFSENGYFPMPVFTINLEDVAFWLETEKNKLKETLTLSRILIYQ